MSRVRRADDILIMQAFAIKMFQKGVPLGPAMLLKYLRGKETDTDIAAHLKSQKQMLQAETDARDAKIKKNKDKRKVTDKQRDRTTRMRTKQSPEAKGASKEANRVARDANEKGRGRSDRKPQDRTKRVRTAGQLEDAKKKRNEAKQKQSSRFNQRSTNSTSVLHS